MSTRSLVIELPAGEQARTPIVVLPPGVASPLASGAAVVIEAGRGGFVLRAQAPLEHVTPIEDQPLAQAGWRVRREAPRVGENTFAEGTQWGQPELRIHPRDGGAPQAVKLTLVEGASVIVGRSSKQAEIVIEDEYVSRRHARFVARGGVIFVEDLASQWGVFVDDQRISAPTALRDGAKLLIGKTRLQFLHLLASLGELPPPPPPPPAPPPQPPLAPPSRATAAPQAGEPRQAAGDAPDGSVAAQSSASGAARRSGSAIAPLAVALGSLGALGYYLVQWLGAAN